MISASGAMGHVTLGGKLDPADLGLAERLVARVTHAPVGDVRDWEAIDAWAEEIVRAAVAEQACGEMGS